MFRFMESAEPMAPSPELMSREDTAVLVVDVQQKLIELIPDGPRVVWNIRRLLDAAALFGIPTPGTEQYPQGLGPTVPELAGRLGALPGKTRFSCAACAGTLQDWLAAGRNKVLAVGIEAHVCVQQTVLDLLAAGFRTYVAADAVGSRDPFDREIAVRRLESSGATITTTEAAMFEWCGDSQDPAFKRLSALVRENPPLRD
jgi:nicotinamidase-related amidase